jgi:hypothetical protein
MLPDALRIAVSNAVGKSWQLDLTSAAIAADPDAWTDDPVDDAEPGLGPLLALGSLVGPVLRYREWDDEGLCDVAIYKPDPEVWERFGEALQRLDVWSWQVAVAADPGTQADILGPDPKCPSAWEISLLWNRRAIDIHGEGLWPPSGSSSPGPEWSGFMKAVHRFAGGRGFTAY